MTTTATNPAAKKPATRKASQKPAAEKPAVTEGVGIKELAKELNRTPKSVRAAIRRLKGGAQVGKGKRYVWKSTKDPQFRELVTLLSTSNKAEEAE